MRFLVSVVSSMVAFCGDLRCDHGHASLSGMVDLVGLRVMHLMIIPTRVVMLRARARAKAMHARVFPRSMVVTASMALARPWLWFFTHVSVTLVPQRSRGQDVGIIRIHFLSHPGGTFLFSCFVNRRGMAEQKRL